MIMKAKPIKDEVCLEEYFWKKDVIAERESIARELEDIVKAHGGEPYRYTSYDEELLELAKELREAREIKEKDGSDMCAEWESACNIIWQKKRKKEARKDEVAGE